MQTPRACYSSLMRIVSWNGNGLRSLGKNGYWETFLKGAKPDIFCLQETKAEQHQSLFKLLSAGSIQFP